MEKLPPQGMGKNTEGWIFRAASGKNRENYYCPQTSQQFYTYEDMERYIAYADPAGLTIYAKKKKKEEDSPEQRVKNACLANEGLSALDHGDSDSETSKLIVTEPDHEDEDDVSRDDVFGGLSEGDISVPQYNSGPGLYEWANGEKGGNGIFGDSIFDPEYPCLLAPNPAWTKGELKSEDVYIPLPPNPSPLRLYQWAPDEGLF